MSAWLPTAPCTPQSCAVHRGPAVAVPAAAGRLLCGIGVLVAGVVFAPAVALLGAAHRDRIARRWSRALLRGFGVRVLVHDSTDAAAGPRDGGVLVVANHISWLDIPLIATVFPGRNLAKSEIRGWPVLGAVASGGGTLFVERERLRALPGAVRTLAQALGAGSRVVVFPEACTWCGGEGGRFTSAVFQAALEAGTPVRPVRIAYRGAGGLLSGAPAFVGDDTLPASLWRVAVAGGLTAELTVLPPIPAGAFPDRRKLAAAARGAVHGPAALAGTHLPGPVAAAGTHLPDPVPAGGTHPPDTVVAGGTHLPGPVAGTHLPGLAAATGHGGARVPSPAARTAPAGTHQPDVPGRPPSSSGTAQGGPERVPSARAAAGTARRHAPAASRVRAAWRRRSGRLRRPGEGGRGPSIL